MKLVLIVYQDRDALDRFVRAVATERVAGVTIVPSSGIGRHAERTADEFQFGLSAILESRFAKHTTLLSIVPDERLPRLLELMRQHMPTIEAGFDGLYAVLEVSQAGGVA